VKIRGGKRKRGSAKKGKNVGEEFKTSSRKAALERYVEWHKERELNGWVGVFVKPAGRRLGEGNGDEKRKEKKKKLYSN